MTRAEVQQGVKEIVIDILEAEEDLKDFGDEDDFVEDLDMDSLQAVSMLVHLEKRFSVTLPESDMNRFRTVRSVVDVVMANLENRAN
jgi:acyl carrier protein